MTKIHQFLLAWTILAAIIPFCNPICMYACTLHICVPVCNFRIRRIQITNSVDMGRLLKVVPHRIEQEDSLCGAMNDGKTLKKTKAT